MVDGETNRKKVPEGGQGSFSFSNFLGESKTGYSYRESSLTPDIEVFSTLTFHLTYIPTLSSKVNRDKLF